MLLNPHHVNCLLVQDAEGADFDYNDVHITESAMSKTYEDASLLEDLTANANEAFQQAETEARNLAQKDNLGFFAANLKAEQNKVWSLQNENVPVWVFCSSIQRLSWSCRS